LTLKSVQMERMLPSSLSIAAGMIILGMVFDCFDGLVARVTRSATNFGGQLDSLADVVTCGAAPATLMVAFMTKELATDSILPSPVSPHFLGRIAWVSAVVYVAFAAIRLARYNVEHDRADFDYRTFRGLPSPGAATLMVALVLLHEQLGPMAAGIIVYSMPAAAIATAFLMVSRIPYKRFYRAYLVARQPFTHLLIFIAVFAIFWSHKAWTLLVLVLWYWASGPIEWVIRALRGKRAALPAGARESGEDVRKLA
jgi:CDP-diacylglycerol--serine O-phosphatidyltransferase